MIDTRLETDWQRLKEYAVALEHTRSDLMGANEELCAKIGALERGNLDLQDQLADVRELLARVQPARLIGELESIRGYLQVIDCTTMDERLRSALTQMRMHATSALDQLSPKASHDGT